MFKKRNKVERSLDERKWGNRILRMLRLDKGFAPSPACLEEKNQENACAIPWKEFRNILSEAEYNKAQALLISQEDKQRFY